MTQSTTTVAQQIVEVVSAFQKRSTGHMSEAVTAILSEDTLVITPHNALVFLLNLSTAVKSEYCRGPRERSRNKDT